MAKAESDDLVLGLSISTLAAVCIVTLYATVVGVAAYALGSWVAVAIQSSQFSEYIRFSVALPLAIWAGARGEVTLPRLLHHMNRR